MTAAVTGLITAMKIKLCQGTCRKGQFTGIGKLGRDLDVEAGYQAARLVMLNCLASIKAEVGIWTRSPD